MRLRLLAPDAEKTEERWRLTTSQGPVMHAVLPCSTRDQFIARHKANHLQVVHTPDKAAARRGMFAKEVAMKKAGLKCFVWRDKKDGAPARFADAVSRLRLTVTL